MRLRRIFLLALMIICVVGLYRFATLIVTSAKVLGSDTVFDWWHGPIARSSIFIGTIPADVYTGPGSREPLLLIHGVNETGKNAPEVKHVAEAFAGSGYRVVVPEFVRLTRQNVTPEDVD